MVKRTFWTVVLAALLLNLLMTSRATQAASSLPYQNPSLPVEQRVDDLLARMTLDEKIGQMTLVEKDSIKVDDIPTLAIGGILSGGGGSPKPNTAENWAAMTGGFQKRALESRLAIPIIYGVDAVHGHGNLYGATIFPQNIGLGATRDADLVQRINRVTAQEMIATGIYWNYSPVVAVPQDVRWGRTYEGFSENTALVSTLAVATLRGLQGAKLGDPMTVLATPKHFVGDGGAVWGTSKTENYKIDQGITDVDEATLRAIHLPPYKAVVDAGAMSVMVSFSSWGGKKMHAQKALITDVLKGELGFKGFVVSDWQGIDQISKNYDEAIVTAINAGIDMNMVPYDYKRFISTLKKAIERGDVPTARIDDAVRRVLKVKLQVGLFEHPYADDSLLAQVGSSEHRAVAREAVSKSLVLLQNKNKVLPIAKNTPHLFVAGRGADDIGMQSGGWTMEWQGKTGNITTGTTIWQAIQKSVSSGTEVQFDASGEFKQAVDAAGNPIKAEVGIVIVAEPPYAEGRGDRADLSLPAADTALIARMREHSEKLIVIILSGRPLVITPQLKQADAFVAAWLPGTEGQGVTDILFGDKPFTGKTAYSWPRSMKQVPLSAIRTNATGCDAALFPFGFGLSVDQASSDQPDCGE